MANVYRKSLMEKLSSPDQLDKMITIISPSFWIAAVGGGVIILAALIWSLVGRLPVNVNTNGIYMVRGGIHAVYAETGGTVESVLISEGEIVTKGEPLVVLNSKKAQEAVSSLEERIAGVEAITFDSEGDAASADNKSLLDIKAQKLAGSAQLTANQALLDWRKQELQTQDAKVAQTKKAFEDAQKAYFASIGADMTSAAQVAYQNAQTELANSRSYLENAKASMSQVRSNAAPLDAQRTKLESDLAAARTELEKAQSAFDAARDEMFEVQNSQQAAQARLTETQTELSVAQTELSTAYSEKSTAESVLLSAQSNKETVDSQVLAENTSRKDIDAQIKELNQTIDGYTKDIGDIEQQLADPEAVAVLGEDKVSELKTALADAKEAKNALIARRSQLQAQLSTIDAASDKVDEWEKKYSNAKKAYDNAENEYKSLSDDYNSLSARVTKLGNELNEKNVAYQEANAELSMAQSKVNNLEAQLDNVQSQLNSQSASLDTATYTLDDWQKRVAEAQERYDAAEKAYLKAMQDAANQQAESNRQNTQYNIALNNYQTEMSTRRSLDDSIVQLMAQIAAEQENLDTQNASLIAQFDSAKASILDQLDRERKEAVKQLDACTVRSTLDGVVSGLNVVVGSVLQQTQAVCKVTSNGDEGDAVICYASIADGRKIAPGMRVVVYPSTVNRQEYGHMEATVIEVADFVTSVEDMRNQLGDETLVQSFTQGGPVIAVTCELRRDESTASGYWWSNRKGRTVEIAQGTLISTDTVIEEKAPITMLIPLLKEKLTIKPVSKQEQS